MFENIRIDCWLKFHECSSAVFPHWKGGNESESMKIGKYEIEDELGRGAMGVVYRARDPLLDRHVAIKLLSSENLDELSLPLFEREAKLVARMSHPNIVVVYEYDYYEGEPYIVMEILKGISLDERADAERLPLPMTLDIIFQTLTGLQHAHEQGVIHRDIKPTNIFIMEPNGVKILDFGIARLSAAGSATTSGFVLGTPEYMSPEQVKAEPLDGRSDLFSVGSMLYWLFTGETPFSDETAESTMFRIVSAEPPPLKVPGVSPFVHRTLQGILNRALSKNPTDRYSTAAEMASEVKDLMILLEHEPELLNEEEDFESADTVQLMIPGFSTTRKDEKKSVSAPVATPEPKEPDPEVAASRLEPTMMMRQEDIASPVPEKTSRDTNATLRTPVETEDEKPAPQPIEQGHGSKRNLVIGWLVVLVVLLLALFTKCPTQ